jgi:hypothetical protein
MALNRAAAATLVALLIASPAALAFRSTDFESYTDPDYKGYAPKKIILMVTNASNETRQNIEQRLAETLKKSNVIVVPYREYFPPTRQWSKEDQAAILQREGVDSGMIITIGASSSSVIPIATQTYGSYGVFGSYGSNGTFNANGSGSSTSYNIVSTKSKAETSVVLLHLEANRTAWYADITTKASGTLFVSEKGDAKAFVKGIVSGLKEDGHLSGK